MIYKIHKAFNNIDELTQFIDTGVLFVHRKESGTYLMLSQSIQSLIAQEKSLGTIHQNLYSIDDEHSIFDQVFTLFQIQYLPALLVIENSEVMKVTHEPISKMELINHISI